jgi:hypothetical protein
VLRGRAHGSDLYGDRHRADQTGSRPLGPSSSTPQRGTRRGIGAWRVSKYCGRARNAGSEWGTRFAARRGGAWGGDQRSASKRDAAVPTEARRGRRSSATRPVACGDGKWTSEGGKADSAGERADGGLGGAPWIPFSVSAKRLNCFPFFHLDFSTKSTLIYLISLTEVQITVYLI